MNAAGGSTVELRSDRGPTAGDPSAARSLHHNMVVTPEGVVLEFRAAGVGSRMLAKWIDFFIQGIVGIVSLILAVVTVAAVSGAAGIIAVLLLLFAVLYGYPIALETLWDGKTVGKRVLGIKALTIEGGPVTLRHSTIRALLGTIDFWFPAPGGLLALAFALGSKRSQRLGDLAAGTIVIREPKSGQAPVYFGLVQGAEAYGLTVDASRLEAHHYTLVREYLLRSGEFSYQARQELGELLATRVSITTGTPRPAGLDAERYLISILFAHQERYRPTQLPPAAPLSAPGPATALPPAPGPPTAPLPPPDPRTRVG